MIDRRLSRDFSLDPGCYIATTSTAIADTQVSLVAAFKHDGNHKQSRLLLSHTDASIMSITMSSILITNLAERKHKSSPNSLTGRHVVGGASKT